MPLDGTPPTGHADGSALDSIPTAEEPKGSTGLSASQVLARAVGYLILCLGGLLIGFIALAGLLAATGNLMLC